MKVVNEHEIVGGVAFQNEVEPLLCRNVVTHDIMSATKDADMVKYLQSIPAAAVRPVVRGKWKERRFSEDVYGAECSVCHTTWDYDTNFCPNCGAEMEES